ncbi:homoserine dehydrogenase [Ferrimicrobium sp.]|uniref:homoserine dehydrogenase n=1 Tax=Ferrimicrobium sp. TaxID=2926050 RepID=UPI0026065242|nr:homoserine dehydrogenase [Ferrimicrobium sp.]
MKIGLLGCGTVGSALVSLLDQEGDRLAYLLGEPLEVGRILVRNPDKARSGPIPAGLLTTQLAEVIDDDEIEVVVELIGPGEFALSAIRAALGAKKSVVTANKEILSTHFPELELAAQAVHRDIFFEAAVAGGIPLIRALRVSLFGERLSRIVGIVNGTTNYILTRMQEEHLSLEAALVEAQQLGYAEADPSGDLSGRDAASKLAIIASIAFGGHVDVGDVTVDGIWGVTPSDFDFAERSGGVIKLLAQAERDITTSDAPVRVEVFPAIVMSTHPLASVRGSFNAVFVEGSAVGQLMFSGPGAGGLPTASAVLADVIDAVKNLRNATRAPMRIAEGTRFVEDSAIEAVFALSMEVVDAPGVLAQVSEVFGQHGVSIARMEQDELGGELAHLVFLTHRTRLSAMKATMAALAGLDVIERLHQILRVLE